MKKYLFIAMCLLIAGTVNAQNYHPNHHHGRGHRGYHRENRNKDDFYQPKVGLEAGLNIANTVDYYNRNFSTNSLLGVNAGLTFEIPIFYPLSFQPEILYSQKGYKASSVDGEFTQRTHYIDIPLLAKFRIVRGLNFLVGPQLNFLVSTTNTYNNGFNTIYEERYNNNGGKSYVSGVLGISIDLNPNVDLHARYALDFQQNTPDNSSQVPPYRNQVWQIGVGFKFE